MTYYFSKISLKQDSLSLRKLSQYGEMTTYFYHQLLWRLFADSSDKQRDFIYRVQFERQWPSFYVVSKSLPLDEAGLFEIQSKPYLPKLQIGQRLHFVLQASPQITTKHTDGRKVRFDVIQHAVNGPQKRFEKITPEVVQAVGEQWLSERSEKHGFTLESVIADHFKKERFYKSKQANPISYSTLDYTGLLTVQDPSLFVSLLYNGIGSAKGFGCGLMMVRS